tara:strand:+ start:845 stop:1231 length:387 start_codon:yes stop_codon:yes gene_type:complete
MITFGYETGRKVIAYLGDLPIGSIEEIDVSTKSKKYKCVHNEGLWYDCPTLSVAQRWFEQFGLEQDVPIHEVENEDKEEQERERFLLSKITKLEAENRDLSERNINLQEVVLNLNKVIGEISDAIKKL